MNFSQLFALVLLTSAFWAECKDLRLDSKSPDNRGLLDKNAWIAAAPVLTVNGKPIEWKNVTTDGQFIKSVVVLDRQGQEVPTGENVFTSGVSTIGYTFLSISIE